MLFADAEYRTPKSSELTDTQRAMVKDAATVVFTTQWKATEAERVASYARSFERFSTWEQRSDWRVALMFAGAPPAEVKAAEGSALSPVAYGPALPEQAWPPQPSVPEPAPATSSGSRDEPPRTEQKIQASQFRAASLALVGAGFGLLFFASRVRW